MGSAFRLQHARRATSIVRDMRSPPQAGEPNTVLRLAAMLAAVGWLGWTPAHAAIATSQPKSAVSPARSAVERGPASAEVRTLVARVAQANDHGSAPFLVVDKRAARLYVFDQRAQQVASTAILLGAARGDDTVPGIGDRKIGDILPHERTTPAGRFVGEAGRNLQGEAIIWVDYDAAVSMHRVRASNAKERRLERLATPTAADNRISYGCINVPVAFFDRHVFPLFEGRRKAMIYVLPETRSVNDVFGVLAAR